MFKYYFEQIHNVEIWPIISLTIFFVFFVGLLIYVAKMEKAFTQEMADMPLADDDTASDFQPENF
jgi:cytochrome c oxidase cbb3-type subunit 3